MITGIDPYSLPTRPLKQNDFSSVRALDWACPLISIDGALKAYGVELALDDLMWAACYDHSLAQVTRFGLSISQMVRVIARLGFCYEHYVIYEREKFAYRFLLRELQAKRPVIIFPPNHCVCVYGVENDELLYLEPDDLTQDYSRMPVDSFLQYWKGNQKVLVLLVIKN
ncbi:MAG: hypothetical protein HYV97_13675 [Bdellovibrio sp.]|nr:hypothetical protein [Bdellovibrio sp.]